MSIINWIMGRRRRIYFVAFNYKERGGMACANHTLSGPAHLKEETIDRMKAFLATKVKQDPDSHIIISFIHPLEYCE